ncbi:MAG: 50S ribosomal protein L18 [Peptococcaceae bacterium BICA1-8]|nr:MAG: 50S ribosomal protein L18 [Peptococcaceae bacterium BICA1-8]
MITKTPKKKIRAKKHWKLRHTITGTPERPRLSVYRSLNNVYAQVIDDVAGVTLAAASSLDLEGLGGNVDAAKKVGAIVAQRALEKGITKVVFDRGGNIYHGRIKALAEGAREAGLDF